MAVDKKKISFNPLTQQFDLTNNVANMVDGPASATDNAVVRYDATTGKLIQNSNVTIDDAGSVQVPEIATPTTPASGFLRIYAKSDGNLYYLNDAGVESGVGITSSGTYTPTITNSTNVASTTAFVSQWMRVGNVVTVSGIIVMTQTLVLTTTELGISLPIASNFVNSIELGGSIDAGELGGSGRIVADATNDRAAVRIEGVNSTASRTYSFIFTYLII
jgi:hypothetical protein